MKLSLVDSQNQSNNPLVLLVKEKACNPNQIMIKSLVDILSKLSDESRSIRSTYIMKTSQE